MENYYAILECDENASTEELKKNYQRLIKLHHPDKTCATSEQFLLIDKAYKTLKNEQSRKDYNAALFADHFKDNVLIYAVLSKIDIKLNSENKNLFRCRCGSEIIIEKEHLEDDECVIECSECSNAILIR